MPLQLLRGAGRNAPRGTDCLGCDHRPKRIGELARCSIIQERIGAGIARARAQGTRRGKPIGRVRIDPARKAAIRAALASGKGILKVARELGTGSSVGSRRRQRQRPDAGAGSPGCRRGRNWRWIALGVTFGAAGLVILWVEAFWRHCL